LTRPSRQIRNPLAAIITHGLLAAAALVVSVLGPFVVQCRAPNGTVAAKFLFSECPVETGCCADVENEAATPREGAGGDFRVTCYDKIPCGGCSEDALFWFVGSRSARGEARPMGPISIALMAVHPASALTEAATDPRHAAATALELPLSPREVHRVLQI
jgi:hypothetical protein